MPPKQLPATTIKNLRQHIQEGRSFAVLAKDLATSLSVTLETAFEAVMEVAKFQPFVPQWHLATHLRTHDRLIKVTRAFHCPSILLLDNVLGADECQEIMARAKTSLAPSIVTTNNKGSRIDAKRRSETTYLNRGMDDFIGRIDQRCADIMHSPVEYGESLQVVRYQVGGEYRPHYDFLPPNHKPVNGGNRTATLLMYLNDVEDGGETYFPGLGLAVKPTRGSALYFHYVDPLGRFDPQSLHAGAPLKKGEKWIVTKWARQREHLIP